MSKTCWRTCSRATGPTIAPVGSFNNELGVPLTVLRADDLTKHPGRRDGRHEVSATSPSSARIAPPTIGVVLNVGTRTCRRVRLAGGHRAGQGRAGRSPSGRGHCGAQRRRSACRADGARTSAHVLTFGVDGDVAARTGDASMRGRAALHPRPTRTTRWRSTCRRSARTTRSTPPPRPPPPSRLALDLTAIAGD